MRFWGGAARAMRIHGFRSQGPLVAGGGRERGCSKGGGGRGRRCGLKGSTVTGVWSRAAGVSGDAVRGEAARAVRIQGFRSHRRLVASGGRERGCG